jgi:putative nucleotidyltransferase with HDIG domain
VGTAGRSNVEPIALARAAQRTDSPFRRFGRRTSTRSAARLRDAVHALRDLPALAHARDRLQYELSRADPDAGEIASIVTSDAALTLGVLAATERAAMPQDVRASVEQAVEALPRSELEAMASRAAVYDVFDRSTAASEADRFRVHAVAVRHLAERVQRLSGQEPSGDIAVAAVLHDIGKVALSAAYERYRAVALIPGTPEQRIQLERRELGTDHAAMGGIVARGLDLPEELVMTIEQHHQSGRGPAARVIRLADMLAHHQCGRPVEPRSLTEAAAAAGLSDTTLRWMLYDLARPARSDLREPEASPLSRRQHEVLRLLGEGKRYGEIAAELHLSRHTVRSHLHAIYSKLGVANRAQAVLRGAECGWL